jgi:receptor protein-tyrosine kinase
VAIDQNWQAGEGAAGSGHWRSILDTARTLLRHKTPLLWAAAIGIIAATIFSALQPRMYQSHASIQIQGINENFLSLREIFPTAAPTADNAIYVQTQAEILRQDALIEEVVRKLHLEDRPEFLAGSHRWNRLAAKSTWPAPDARAAVDQVRRHLQIVPLRGSSVIQIVSEARDPQLAANVANALAQTFIDQSIDARQHAARQTQVALSMELEDMRRKILESEAVLDGFGSQFGGKNGKGAATYSTLERELEANKAFYNVLWRRIDEARLASTVSQSNIRLVGPAQPAGHPYKPNLPLNLVVGAFGGLALGIAWVMMREQTSSVLHAPGEAAACLTVPELGAIPRAGNRAFPMLLMGGPTSPTTPVELAALEQSCSGLSESFRATLASILSESQSGNHPRSWVVTSSRPLEGKTTVASNLAIALAEISHNVLLIDGDMRRPRLHKIFDQPNSWGLSDLLREKNAVEELPLDALTKRTMVPRLFLLPGGTSAENIFSLLWSGRMARLFTRFRQEFDYVILDTPPCLEFADARILGRYVERLLLVVRADRTDRKTAQAALDRLALDGIPVMGVIFNCWDASHSDTYNYAHCRQDLA